MACHQLMTFAHHVQLTDRWR